MHRGNTLRVLLEFQSLLLVVIIMLQYRQTSTHHNLYVALEIGRWVDRLYAATASAEPHPASSILAAAKIPALGVRTLLTSGMVSGQLEHRSFRITDDRIMVMFSLLTLSNVSCHLSTY